MEFLWKPKFLAVNILTLLIVKAAFAPAWLGVAALTQEAPSYTRGDIIYATNQYRENIGLKPFIESQVLDIAAAQKLQDMLQHQYFAHFSPDGTSPWHWFEVNKYAYTYAGENLAIGFWSAQATVTAWVNSPAHRRNLTNENYREIGVAVQYGKIKDLEGMIVVQFFGTPVGSAPQVAQKKSGIGITFSASSAKETPTPVPSPSPSLSPSPLRSPAVVPVVAKAITPSPTPQMSSFDIAPQANRFLRALDTSFMIYALMVAVLAAAYFAASGFRRRHIPLAAAHISIFMLSVLVPLSEAVQRGFIN